jgi:hypothetical protein
MTQINYIMKEEKKQYEINLILDEDRYNSLVEICKRYNEQQGSDITPKEYILMLIDSALGNK